MVCKKCNTPLAEGATFCSNCGTPTAPLSNFEEYTQPPEIYQNSSTIIQPKKNNPLLFLLLGMVAVLFLMYIVICFFLIDNVGKSKTSDSTTISDTKMVEQEQSNSKNMEQAQVTPQDEQQPQATPQNSQQEYSNSENSQSAQSNEQDIEQTNPMFQSAEETADTITSTEEMISLAYSDMEAPASDFVFPYSRERLLTEEDLRILEATQPDANHDSVTDQEHSNSQMAINEILARYGYPFKSNASKKTGQEAYNKFSSLSWYQQIKPLCSYSSANDLIEDLTSIERQNIAIIDEWQKQHGCYY